MFNLNLSSLEDKLKMNRVKAIKLSRPRKNKFRNIVIEWLYWKEKSMQRKRQSSTMKRLTER